MAAAMLSENPNDDPHDDSERGSAQPATRLLRYFAIAYACLIIYASLHPFSGWRDAGVSPFAFLTLPWPRYWTVFDLATNVAAYVPLGFLFALALRQLPGRASAAIAAFVIGTLLSFCMEAVQTWLPSRVASNVDLGCNALGTAIGALLTCRYDERFFNRVAIVQRELLAPIPYTELGLVVIGLWLLTQLSPETILFGTGDLRRLLEITPTVPYAAHSFFAIETAIIVCNTIALGLFVRTLLSGRGSTFLLLVAFFALALVVRTLAAAILVGPFNASTWFTPGAAMGLLIGGALLTALLFLPTAMRIPIAGLALMAGTVLVNIAEPNPYSAAALAAWRQGHFLNFNGLTRLTASFWPFIALFYFTLIGRKV
jgi:VanZ family protein